ncbi:MAG: putative methyltransferase YcgJ [Parcubacteria group bacterium]|nr:putative methyltransferase YcgJ [Parcubacteria group bacterium]
MPGMTVSDRDLPAHKRALVAFMRALPQGAHLLDIGCGSGKAIRWLHSIRPDVIISGMDINDNQEYMPAGVVFK